MGFHDHRGARASHRLQRAAQNEQFGAFDVNLHDMRLRQTVADERVRGSYRHCESVPGRGSPWIDRRDRAIEKTHAARSRVDVVADGEKRFAVLVGQAARKDVDSRGEVGVFLEVLPQPFAIRGIWLEADDVPGWADEDGEAQRMKADMRADVPDDPAVS